MSHKLTTEEFIEKAKIANHNQYNYDKTIYPGSNKKKVAVTCPIHGDFEVQALSHMQGHGCKKCASAKTGEKTRKTKEQLILDSIKCFGNKFDFHLVTEVKNNKEKIPIICPEHSLFYKTPNSFLRSKYGCPKCGISHLADFLRMTNEEFIEKARSIHGYRYGYDKTEYKGTHTHIVVTCPKHGDFKCLPHNHLQGAMCFKCKIDQYNNKTTPEFIRDAIKAHGNKFDYHKVNYINALTPVTIICPTHGEISETPQYHLKSPIGCHLCSKNTSRMEIEIEKLLSSKLNHLFIPQYKPDWLKPQSLDFYIPSLHIAIECQGLQHFKENHQFPNKTLLEQQERDERKKFKCQDHGISILYFCDEKVHLPNDVIKTHNELLEKIHSVKN